MRRSPIRKMALKVVLLIVELVVVAGIGGGIYLYNSVAQMQGETLGEVTTNEDMDEATVETLSGYTTIALFGLDNRTAGVYESGNSDVVMIMAVNNDTQEVKIVSVYRDTMLDVSDDSEQSFRKCNSAYAIGGVENAVSMLNKNLDLSIDNYISFDFTAVAEAIDILGGVEIEIESQSELTQLNKYIEHTNGVLGTNSSTISSVGTHTLDGVQAVAYSRIRYTAGDDFRRAQRQRIVLSKMIEKAKSASISELTQLITDVFPDISTDLAQSDMLSMAKIMIGYSMDDMRGFPFDRATETISGKGSVVVACTLESNVTELHEYLYSNESYTASQTVQSYSDSIQYISGLDEDDAIDDEYAESDNADEEEDEDSSE